MRMLLWLRSLFSSHPLYNWNSTIPGSVDFVLKDVTDEPGVVLGQSWIVTSVNRSTGKVTMRIQ